MFHLKVIKFFVALVLLPFCIGATRALGLVISASTRSDVVVVALIAGAACWLVIYLLLPRPMWLYVVGHELTHVVWTWLCGGSVKKFKASSQGGYVVVTSNNFLVTLAPYFFPLYAALVVAVFELGNWIGNWSPYRPVFHLLLGAAYAFHLTLTAAVLRTRQTDFTSQGYVFSFVIIWLGNVIVLLLSLPLLTGSATVSQSLSWSWNKTIEIVPWIFGRR